MNILKHIGSSILCLAIFSLPVFALSGVEKLQGQAMKVQSCTEEKDTSTLQNLQKEGATMLAEVKSLCALSKRDHAQQKAINFSKTMLKQPKVKKLLECSQAVGSVIPKMDILSLAGAATKEKMPHVCDQF